MEIVVVVDDHDRPSLESRLTAIVDAASESAPSVRTNVSIVSPQQWDRQQADKGATAHHNVWLAPNTAP